MPRHIKGPHSPGCRRRPTPKSSTVEAIIADVAKRGEAAARELSERFDKWSPPSFRLSDHEIAALAEAKRQLWGRVCQTKGERFPGAARESFRVRHQQGSEGCAYGDVRPDSNGSDRRVTRRCRHGKMDACILRRKR